MNYPTMPTSSEVAALQARGLVRPPRWRDGTRPVLLRLARWLVEAINAWRQAARDRDVLRSLGARELRDIGLARPHELTIGESAIGRF